MSDKLTTEELEREAQDRLRNLCVICEMLPVGPSGFYAHAEKCADAITAIFGRCRELEKEVERLRSVNDRLARTGARIR